MTVTWRHRRTGEFNYELAWLAASLGGLGLATAWLGLGLPWPFCIFHALTGHPCATCGATRAGIALFHGDLRGALLWNPMMFGAYVMLAAFDVYAFVVLVLRLPRLRLAGVSSFQKNVFCWTFLMIVAVNWGYLLLNSRRFA